MTDRVECLVIGAGVVGLAEARACALAGLETIVIEAEAAIGTGTSSRSSEVIHAGIYHAPGSLKARLCVRGRDLPDGTLRPDYAGIRPKIQACASTEADFLIQGSEAHGIPGLVHLYGIESPGLTASLAIAAHALAVAGIRP